MNTSATLPRPHRSVASGCSSRLVYAGIDEAGYGPRLGPLCVAMTVFGVGGWSPSQAAPDLWERLHAVISKQTPTGGAPRIAVADSKKLKRPNSSRRIHPLADLELGVLTFLEALGEVDSPPTTDADLLECLGSPVSDLPEWYQVPPRALPVSTSAELIQLRAAALRRGLVRAAVAPVALRCVVIDEVQLNRSITETGRLKSAISFDAVGALLRELLGIIEPCDQPDEAPRVVIDRQGGRVRYADELARVLPEATITTTHESPEASRYRLELDPEGSHSTRRRRLILTVRVQAEDTHLPVALASMVAKLSRELLMFRFNEYWAQKPGAVDLRPTAGYGLDARRWLSDAADRLSPEERRSLWRRR